MTDVFFKRGKGTDLFYVSTGFGAGSDVQFLTYGFDALGNLKKRTDENQSLTEKGKKEEKGDRFIL